MTIEDLESAVAKLPPEQFDDKIERDAMAGKLDRLADQAIDDFRKGRAREQA